MNAAKIQGHILRSYVVARLQNQFFGLEFLFQPPLLTILGKISIPPKAISRPFCRVINLVAVATFFSKMIPLSGGCKDAKRLPAPLVATVWQKFRIEFCIFLDLFYGVKVHFYSLIPIPQQIVAKNFAVSNTKGLSIFASNKKIIYR